MQPRSHIASALRGDCVPCGPARLLQILLFVSTLFLRPDTLFSSESSATSNPSNAVAVRAMRLLHQECLACHNADKKKGDLAMVSRELLLKGGETGPAAVLSKPEESLMLKVLSPDADPHMPPKKQLTTNQVAVMERWIREGMPWDEVALKGEERSRQVTLGMAHESYQPVVALAVSPDGNRLAVGRRDRIWVYDVASAATNQVAVTNFVAHAEMVRSLAWSSDGRTLASGGYQEISLWDAGDWRRRWQVNTGLVDRVTVLRFSSHGTALVAADGPVAEGGWIRILEPETGHVLAGWQAHQDSIQDISISPDGGLVASAGADKVVRLWESLSRKEVAKLEGHVGAVVGVAFNATGSELVSVGTDKQLKVWDVKTREGVISVAGRKRAFTAAVWSADGKVVVTGDDEGRMVTFSQFKRHTGEQSSATADERQLGQWGEPLHIVAVSGDGQTYFGGAQDGRVFIVNQDGKLRATLEPVKSRPVELVTKDTEKPGNDAPVSFVMDVLPALSRAGCSAGACHAKPDGQAGFKLSVFSFDPRNDYDEIVKEGRGRRVFPAAPAQSLLLLKPTLQLEHGGGMRMEADSELAKLVVRWMAQGMPYQRSNEPALVRIEVSPREREYRKGDTQNLAVKAYYSDGSTRDVTGLADYVNHDREMAQVDEHGLIKIGQLSGESVVVARFMGFVDASHITIPSEHTAAPEQYSKLPSHNFIDELAYTQFQKLGLYPSELCSDSEFVRRTSLDLIGRIPDPAEVRAFLAETNAGKRLKWVDRLLEDPSYADHWANKWADLLRPNPDRVGVKSVYVLDQWLRDSFRENKRYDQFAREILTAEGSNHRDGPAVVYRDRREPPELTTMFSQLFLGVRMECAKCHHHPNEKWSQDDFYQFAAFFGTLKQKGAGLSPPISAGTETFYYAPGGSVRHPVTDAVMKPRPLDGVLLAGAANASEKDDPRIALADWLTQTNNPYFARAAVNRVWASLFGRGFVEPVDDFRTSNPIAQEPLLNALSRDFVVHRFDLKHLLRTVAASRLYQLSSIPNDSNLKDTKNFSRAYRRRLPAEVMCDAVNDITGVMDEFNGCPPDTRALQTWSYKVKSHFLDAFGRPNSSSDCPCERDVRTSVVQSLHMMNSRGLQAKLTSGEGRVKALVDSKRSTEELVSELYLLAVSRFPTADEVKKASETFARKDVSRQEAAEDVLWALLNSPEFVFNH